MPIPPGVPSEIAVIAGCAVITGVGAVLDAVGPCAGRGLVVFGAGGVGLSVVIGAVLAGAYPIAAVDMVPDGRAGAEPARPEGTAGGRQSVRLYRIQDAVTDLVGGAVGRGIPVS